MRATTPPPPSGISSTHSGPWSPAPSRNLSSSSSKYACTTITGYFTSPACTGPTVTAPRAPSRKWSRPRRSTRWSGHRASSMRTTARVRGTGVRPAASLPAAIRSGLLRVMRLLVVRAHRTHRAGAVVLAGVAARTDPGVVARLGERILEAAQPAGREIESLHVHEGLPQDPQRGHVDHLPAAGLRLLALVLDLRGRKHKQLLRHHRLLVSDDVIRPAPHGGDGGDAQLLPYPLRLLPHGGMRTTMGTQRLDLQGIVTDTELDPQPLQDPKTFVAAPGPSGPTTAVVSAAAVCSTALLLLGSATAVRRLAVGGGLYSPRSARLRLRASLAGTLVCLVILGVCYAAAAERDWNRASWLSPHIRPRRMAARQYVRPPGRSRLRRVAPR